jgi:hypothetical protein
VAEGGREADGEPHQQVGEGRYADGEEVTVMEAADQDDQGCGAQGVADGYPGAGDLDERAEAEGEAQVDHE